MIKFIYGGSSSGKSAYAEKCLQSLDCSNKYYLATMNAYDEESRKRIEKHRNARSGKGFITIECPKDVFMAAKYIKPDESSAILLECMSNLVANEMFGNENIPDADECAGKILADIMELSKKTDNLIIVSNNIYEDGCLYDDTTRNYLKALGLINRKLAHLSSESVEVVVGIGIKQK